MTGKKYTYLLYLIIATGVVLTAAQVYFTVQNYKVNKQRFINDVQIALDLGVESYFSDRARDDLMVFRLDMNDTIINGQRARASYSSSSNIDSLLRKVRVKKKGSDTIKLSHAWSNHTNADDTIKVDSILDQFNSDQIESIRVIGETDSNQVKEFQFFTRKVMLSINEELLDIGKLYGMVEQELKRKNLEVEFALKQQSNNGSTTIGTSEEDFLSTTSKSSYLGPSRVISIDFENATSAILLRGISDIALSLLLVGWVMGAMIHLYKTINKQKQIAQIKDDLISNITHEFKTPIATIHSAIEGISNFNEANDMEKTKRYLSISGNQLVKLNGMVEKLLETATIEQGKLSLNKEETEVVAWTRGIVERFKLIAQDKSISFDSEVDEDFISIDSFHMENAIANLIDNAIKYGGNTIKVAVKRMAGQSIWEVEDNGGGIPRDHQQRIFEKLYRIPKGNQHDVKGFGIGLFYARAIAEQHGGELLLTSSANQTLFRLKL